LVFWDAARRLDGSFEYGRWAAAFGLFCAHLLQDRRRISPGGQHSCPGTGCTPRTMRIERDSSERHFDHAYPLQGPVCGSHWRVHLATEPRRVSGPPGPVQIATSDSILCSGVDVDHVAAL